MANSAAVLQGYLGLSAALAGGALPATLREQIALAVAETNQCQYCLSARTAVGKMVGLGEAALAESRQAASSDPKADAALRFAWALVDERGVVSPADVAHVREAGYTDGEIAETIAAVALNLFTNYFNVANGTEIDFPAVPLLVGAAR